MRPSFRSKFILRPSFRSKFILRPDFREKFMRVDFRSKFILRPDFQTKLILRVDFIEISVLYSIGKRYISTFEQIRSVAASNMIARTVFGMLVYKLDNW
ncbi:MAG: hypothetical protein DRR00_09910 [Candidatus Parabeggiatoa sp. nov. 3]|nr:MAG: hypothetical protein DRR00_09910 [Gammaproteobacteria bacterium]RKZ67716.1 MAG: hypothetical protein DRQ99_05825 [Gammaproteobacteria bacterium]HEW97499.1 hypothetical protein [Beggiatoa sp.]